MKLTIEHLSCYLPYGLKFVNSEFTEYTFPLVAVSNISYELNDDDSGIEVILFGDETHIKPLLRPLSQLTETITHNGKTFVPMQVLKEPYTNDERAERFIWTGIETWLYPINFHSEHLRGFEKVPYGIIKQLFSWHFDVFGLIENNLALPK